MLRLQPIPPDSADTARRIFHSLTRESLDRAVVGPFEGLSFINSDGLPFQWVFRFGKGGPTWGFLCESGQPGTSPAARLRHSIACIGAASPQDSSQVRDVLGMLRARLMPAESEPWPAHWRSAMWVGVGVSERGVQLKPYFNLNRGPARDRWLRAGWVLKDAGRTRALARLCALSSSCSQDSWPVGLAVDLEAGGAPGRIKLYLRSAAVTAAWLARWYDALDLQEHAPTVRRLLDLLGRTGTDRYPRSSFIVSVEVHRDERLSLKTDLAVTKWMKSDSAIIEGCRAILQTVSCGEDRLNRLLAAVGMTSADDSCCSSVRFVGLGCEPDGSRHVNVYVAPPVGLTFPTGRAHTSVTIEGAVEQGLKFLASSHVGDHWEDFKLPVGVSDAWITGYVLANAAHVPRAALEPHMPMVRSALDWLAASRTSGGGWGYHGSVPDDADATAWAVLALRAWNRDVPQDAFAILESCNAQGGSGTYPSHTAPAPGWARDAPDVTAVVARARANDAHAAASYFERWIGADGLIPAYWWASRLYTRAMLLQCSLVPQPALTSLRSTLLRFRPAGDFEMALLLACRLRLQQPAAKLARRLAARQRHDGSWNRSAVLRLSRPEIASPWTVIDSGPLYLDEQGVFTTATVLSSLGSLLDERSRLSTGRGRMPVASGGRRARVRVSECERSSG